MSSLKILEFNYKVQKVIIKFSIKNLAKQKNIWYFCALISGNPLISRDFTKIMKFLGNFTNVTLSAKSWKYTNSSNITFRNGHIFFVILYQELNFTFPQTIFWWNYSKKVLSTFQNKTFFSQLINLDAILTSWFWTRNYQIFIRQFFFQKS